MTDTTAEQHALITPAKLRAWHACWQDDRIAAYFAGRAALTAREIADDKSVSRGDRMWVLTNALARKDIWLTYDFALWCAEQALAKLTPEWQAELAPAFDQVRALRGGTWSASRTAGAAAAAYYAARSAAYARAAAYYVGAAAAAARSATEAAYAARSVAYVVAAAADTGGSGVGAGRAAAYYVGAAAAAAWAADAAARVHADALRYAVDLLEAP